MYLLVFCWRWCCYYRVCSSSIINSLFTLVYFLGGILIFVSCFSWTQGAWGAAQSLERSIMAPGCIRSNPSVEASQSEKHPGPRAHRKQPWCSSLRVIQQKMDRKPVVKPSWSQKHQSQRTQSAAAQHSNLVSSRKYIQAGTIQGISWPGKTSP